MEKHLIYPYHESLLLLIRQDDVEKRLLSMHGIGEISAKSIINWFQIHMNDYIELCNELRFEESNSIQYDLKGKVFVITGKLYSFSNRNELKSQIESRGGSVSGSVSKNTDYLINNNITSVFGKNKKAKELGIYIITEEQYLQLKGKRTRHLYYNRGTIFTIIVKTLSTV